MRVLLDNYKDELLKLQETMSYKELSNYLMDTYAIDVEPTTIQYWMRQKGYKKTVQSTANKRRGKLG